MPDSKGASDVLTATPSQALEAAYENLRDELADELLARLKKVSPASDWQFPCARLPADYAELWLHWAAKGVRMVPIAASQQAQALINGDVDAVSAFEFNAFEAEKRLGDNAVSWDSQDSLAYHWLLGVTENTTKSPESLKRLLKAHIKAENFAIINEKETKSIIARKWGFDPVFIEDTWSKTRVGVSFGQSVVIALQEYTNWQISNSGKPVDQHFDRFLDYCARAYKYSNFLVFQQEYHSSAGGPAQGAGQGRGRRTTNAAEPISAYRSAKIGESGRLGMGPH